jgi:hypothetical protein
MVVDGCPSPLQRSLIVAHEVTNVGNDTAHLANMAEQAKAALVVEKLEVVADRGYFDTDEIVACANAGVTLTLSRRMTSNAKAEGHFGNAHVAEGRDRDGAGRARLLSDAGDEHHGRKAAHRGDESVTGLLHLASPRSARSARDQRPSGRLWRSSRKHLLSGTCLSYRATQSGRARSGECVLTQPRSTADKY